jgi:hypothetical protein
LDVALVGSSRGELYGFWNEFDASNLLAYGVEPPLDAWSYVITYAIWQAPHDMHRHRQTGCKIGQTKVRVEK